MRSSRTMGTGEKSEAHPSREFGAFLKTGDVWRVAANSGGRRPMHHRDCPSPSRTHSQPHRHWFIRESPRLSPSVPQKPLSSPVVLACSKARQNHTVNPQAGLVQVVANSPAPERHSGPFLQEQSSPSHSATES